jgi:mRNA interferase MazF
MARREVVIRQGDLFWVAFSAGHGSEPWGRRPALILQHDRFNASRLNTAVVVAITLRLSRSEPQGKRSASAQYRK